MAVEEYTILIIDDDDVDRLNIKRLLDKAMNTYNILETPNLETGLNLCLGNLISCILIDYRMPGMNGLEFIKQLSQQSKKPLPPIIMLTGMGSEQLAVAAMQSGAKDYINKNNLTVDTLEQTILGCINRNSTEKITAKPNEDASRFALYASSTYTHNRDELVKDITGAFSSAKRYGRNASLFYIDVDDFDDINKIAGRYLSDLLLKKIAEKLQTNLRKSDYVHRLRGDQYIVILSEVDCDTDAGFVAKKLIDRFQEPIAVNDKQIKVNISIGIACFPTDSVDASTLIEDGDIAMHRVKQAGKGYYQYYNQKLQENHEYQHRIMSLINDSIKNHELYLAYQPIVNLKTKKIAGFELLSRWHCTALNKIIPPNVFIPIVESTDFIQKHSQWLLQSAYDKYLEWQDHHDFSGYLSINLSNAQLKQNDFFKSLQQFIKVCPLPQNALHFEATENSIMKYYIKTKYIFDLLNQADCKIDIDGFGMGFTSFSKMRNLPVHGIKIDRALVSDIGNPKTELIIRAIIAMAHTLRMEVTAVGIETPNQLAFLQQEGCDKGQGYLFSEPLTSDEVVQLFLNKIAVLT